MIYETHVRGFTRQPELGRRARAARHVRRDHRAHPLSRRSRRHGRRAAAGLPVRSPWPPPAGLATTGATRRSRSSLRTPATAADRERSARSTSSAISSRRCTGRHRGDPRRRLQPHRRRRTPTARRSAFRGLANDDYYILDAGPRALRRLQRLRQHAQRQPVDRPPPHPRQPALLGRRRCTSTASASTWPRSCHATRRGQPLERPADPVGHRDATRSSPAPSSSPKRGTPPGSTRSAASSATAGWNGTAVSATTCARFVKGDADGRGGRDSACSAARTSIGHLDREPEQSINFVTCHDGFTLNDLVSYNDKHNEANGEANRDGSDENLSWNCGVEGPSDDPAIEALRRRQIKNLVDTRCSSLGAPDAARWATRSAAPSAATTTRTARTTS